MIQQLPPDKLPRFELLRLMVRQGLDFSRELVVELLDEVERLNTERADLCASFATASRVDIAVEREACAKVAEAVRDQMAPNDPERNGCDYVAAAIRARGEGK